MDVNIRQNGRISMSPPKPYNLSKGEMEIINKFMFEPVGTPKTNSITGTPQLGGD
jgi:hypothetical protein